MAGRKTVVVNINPIQANELTDESTTFLVSGLSSWRIRVRSRVWRPPTDLFESDDQFFVRVEIAGMNDAEFSISYFQGVLSIGGVRNDIATRKAFHQLEIPFGEFSTDIEIPSNINVEQIEAHYSDGFLWVTLPKIGPTNIKINL